jgi:hypothetical protein
VEEPVHGILLFLADFFRAASFIHAILATGRADGKKGTCLSLRYLTVRVSMVLYPGLRKEDSNVVASWYCLEGGPGCWLSRSIEIGPPDDSLPQIS